MHTKKFSFQSLYSNASSSSRAFIPPPAPLESQLEAFGVTKDSYNLNLKLKLLNQDDKSRKRNSTFYVTGTVTLFKCTLGVLIFAGTTTNCHEFR